MPSAYEIIQNQGGHDVYSEGGQLVEDSGVMSDIDGGFDTYSCTLLFPSKPKFDKGGEHKELPGMFLFGVSPKPIVGGAYLVTLTYKGFYGREIGIGTPPPAGSLNAKFTYGVQMSQKTWPKGTLSGTVDGVTLSNFTVNVLQPLQTVKVTWIGNAKVDPNVFNLPSGEYGPSYGPIDEKFYFTLTDAAYNFPHGWVPTDASSEQAYAKIQVFLNSVTFTAIPKYSPA